MKSTIVAAAIITGVLTILIVLLSVIPVGTYDERKIVRWGKDHPRELGQPVLDALENDFISAREYMWLDYLHHTLIEEKKDTQEFEYQRDQIRRAMGKELKERTNILEEETNE